MKKWKVGVLLGGTSREREISIRSGKRVAESLRQQDFPVMEIDPAQSDLLSTLREQRVEVAFIMLHGKPGEDGSVQELLESQGIPYTGSRGKASSICINKVATKRVLLEANLPTPTFMTLEGELPPLSASLHYPVIVKPVDEGSSFGVTLVEKAEDFAEACRQTLQNFGNGFVEQFIQGTEVTVGILGTGDKAFALPILELRPQHRFYDFQAKYTPGLTEFILPAELPAGLYQHTQEIALAAYRALDCRGFGRVDIQVDRQGTPFITEINTIPGMTELSDLPAEASHAGISFDELVERVLQSAWE